MSAVLFDPIKNVNIVLQILFENYLQYTVYVKNSSAEILNISRTFRPPAVKKKKGYIHVSMRMQSLKCLKSLWGESFWRGLWSLSRRLGLLQETGKHCWGLEDTGGGSGTMGARRLKGVRH